MKRTEMIDAIYAHDGVTSRRMASEVLDLILDTIAEQVAAGNEVQLTGFGTFKKTHHPSRPIRDMRSQELRATTARDVPRFTPGSVFRRKVSGEA